MCREYELACCNRCWHSCWIAVLLWWWTSSGSLMTNCWNITIATTKQVIWAKLTWRGIAAVLLPGQLCTTCNKIIMLFEGIPKFWGLRKENSLNVGGQHLDCWKWTFYAKNFIGLRRLSRFISSHFGAIHSWNVHRSWKLKKNNIISYYLRFKAISGHQCWHHIKDRH